MNKKSNIIYGIHPVLEALRSGSHFERVFLQKNFKGHSHKELMMELNKFNVPVSKVPIERIHKFTQNNHQGVVALASPIQYHTLNQLVPNLFEQGVNPLILMLDEVTDVRNFGAIGRTAECLGVHGIVIPTRGGAQVNEDAVNTSAGALHHLPVCREGNLLETTKYLKESGFNVVACSEKSNQHLKDMNFSLPTLLIVGSEENGVSSSLLEIADGVAKVKMEGKIESLNVSVATGMALYEVRRQRN